jgi:hypothetical protein
VIGTIDGRVAQAFDLLSASGTVGCPVLAFFARAGMEMPAAAKLRRSISKRNLGPALIHSNRSGFFEKIVSITAPAPLLGRLHESAFHRIAMHVAQLLHAFLRRPHIEVVEARLPEGAVQPALSE